MGQDNYFVIPKVTRTMSVATIRNVQIIPPQTKIINGLDPKIKHLPKSLRPKSIPPTSMPAFGKPVVLNKNERFAVDFFATHKRLQKEEAFQQATHDYLNIPNNYGHAVQLKVVHGTDPAHIKRQRDDTN